MVSSKQLSREMAASYLYFYLTYRFIHTISGPFQLNWNKICQHKQPQSSLRLIPEATEKSNE